MTFDGETVAGCLHLGERCRICLCQAYDLCGKDVRRAGQHRIEGIDKGRILVPFLGFFLKHQPKTYAVGDLFSGNFDRLSDRIRRSTGLHCTELAEVSKGGLHIFT